MSSNLPTQTSKIMILAALALFVVAFIHFAAHQYTLDAYSTVVLLVAAFFSSAGVLSNRFSKIEFGLSGIKTEAHDLANSINALSTQVRALGHLAVFEQVSALNRLAIERPELTSVWKGMEGLTNETEKVRQIFYIYCFLDAFEMMRQFREGELLAEEFYKLWCENWIPQLLNSDAGKLMQEREMLDYYSEAMLKACNLPVKAK